MLSIYMQCVETFANKYTRMPYSREHQSPQNPTHTGFILSISWHKHGNDSPRYTNRSCALHFEYNLTLQRLEQKVDKPWQTRHPTSQLSAPLPMPLQPLGAADRIVLFFARSFFKHGIPRHSKCKSGYSEACIHIFHQVYQVYHPIFHCPFINIDALSPATNPKTPTIPIRIAATSPMFRIWRLPSTVP